MNAIILRCDPGSRFHFGQYAPDPDTALTDTSLVIHSDTLLGIIVKTYDSLFTDTDKLIANFSSGDIRISSGYFCLEFDGQYTWFLPKPVSFNLVETPGGDQKKLKKIQFISKGIWEQLGDPSEIANDNIIIVQDRFALLRSELPAVVGFSSELKFYHQYILPKVNVRRENEKGGLYQLSVLEIADLSQFCLGNSVPQIHYYFLMQTSHGFEQEFGNSLKTVWDILSEGSIGADRSMIGKISGISKLNWQSPEFGSAFYSNISLLNVIKDELSDVLYYNTVLRGGRRIGGDVGYRQLLSVRMIGEGAVLRQDIKGNLVDITPEEEKSEIFKRNGISINLSIPASWVKE